MSMTYTTKTTIASLALAFATLTGCNTGPGLPNVEIDTAVTTVPETVEVHTAATLEAEVVVGVDGASQARDFGGPVEELR